MGGYCAVRRQLPPKWRNAEDDFLTNGQSLLTEASGTLGLFASISLLPRASPSMNQLEYPDHSSSNVGGSIDPTLVIMELVY
jgi:hypothetical protein